MPITDNLNVTAVGPYPGQITQLPSLGSKAAVLDTGTIAFGTAATFVDGTKEVIRVPTATGQKFAGVVIRPEGAVENNDDGTIGAYEATRYPDVSYTDWVEGIAVTTNTQVAVGDKVYFVHSGAEAGQFRNDNTTADEVVGAEFVRVASATVASIQLRKQPA